MAPFWKLVYNIGYVSTEDKANEVFKEIEELVKKDQLKVESGTIVVKTNEGVVKLQDFQDDSRPWRGPGWFLGPVCGSDLCRAGRRPAGRIGPGCPPGRSGHCERDSLPYVWRLSRRSC